MASKLYPKMFRPMISIVILCLHICSYTQASEELVVVHSPETVKFLSNEPVHSSYLGDIMGALFAYTIDNKIEWNSLAIVSPWKRPEAIVVLELFGFNQKVDFPLDGDHFLLENSGDIGLQFDSISYQTQERFFDKLPVLLHMELGEELHDSKIVQPLLLKTIPADPNKRLSLALHDPDLGSLFDKSTFNSSIPSEAKLLTELATAKALLKSLHGYKVELKNRVPDVFWLKIDGLQPISTTYGVDSFQFAEALRLLRQMISEVKEGMKNIYDGNVVVMIIKENESPSTGFKNRKLLEEATIAAPTPDKNYNLAAKWDPMFPVIFIIIFLVSIFLALSVIGVSLSLWFMDPGRDSIIYRHTSQRIKKD